MKKFEIYQPENAPKETQALLEGIQKSMSFVPNIMGVMAASKPVLNSYLALSDFFSKTSFSPIEQQSILLSVSHFNECSYCLAAHSTLARNTTDMQSNVIRQLKTGEKLDDPRLNTLSEFTKVMVSSRGNPSESDLETFYNAGFEQHQVLELIVGIAMKTISNYTNHLAKTPIDEAFSENSE